jgi:hypothetical protein
MKDRQKKGRRAGAGLSPLPPDRAAALQEQMARLAEALAAGEELPTLQELVTPRGDDLAWDLHLLRELEKIPHPAIPPLLAALFGQSPDKERRKALKRAWHVMQTRGVPVSADLLPREQPASSVVADTSALVARLSPVFGNGERYVVLEGPREILDGNLLVARLSDESGLRECHPLSLKRKQQEEFWEHFRSQGLSDWATVPPDYAVRLLEEALALTPDGEPSRDAYLPLRENLWRHVGRFDDIPPLEARLPTISPEERRGLLEEARSLAAGELCRSWLPSLEDITPWVDKIQEIQDSPLVLTEQQQHRRHEDVAEEAAAELFPEETRPRWGRRLLETAYFLDLLGRGTEARAAQAAGEDLLSRERSTLVGENPFLQELVRIALTLAWEYRRPREPQPETSPLVVPPTEPLIRR